MNLIDYANWTDKVWVKNINPDLDLSAEVLGLTEEAGEVAGKVRKYLQGRPLSREELAKELGDVFFFWSRVAKRFNLTPQEIVMMNQDKLESRQQRGVLIAEGDNR
jgi:MazG nucleotide pyrophosphohydrolase domain.